MSFTQTIDDTEISGKAAFLTGILLGDDLMYHLADRNYKLQFDLTVNTFSKEAFVFESPTGEELGKPLPPSVTGLFRDTHDLDTLKLEIQRGLDEIRAESDIPISMKRPGHPHDAPVTSISSVGAMVANITRSDGTVISSIHVAPVIETSLETERHNKSVTVPVYEYVENGRIVHEKSDITKQEQFTIKNLAKFLKFSVVKWTEPTSTTVDVDSA